MQRQAGGGGCDALLTNRELVFFSNARVRALRRAAGVAGVI
jgi:hypothetical protein